MNDDPGWNLTWKTIPSALISQRATNQADNNALSVIRLSFVAFSTALVVITGVLLVVTDGVEREEQRATLSTSIVLIYGVFGLVAGRRFKRQLDCRSGATLATSYRERFFLRLAFAEASALVGFAVAISLGPRWVYFIGLCFAIVGFVLLAPSRRNLTADQRELSANGCHRSLTRALLDHKPATDGQPTT